MYFCSIFSTCFYEYSYFMTNIYTVFELRQICMHVDCRLWGGGAAEIPELTKLVLNVSLPVLLSDAVPAPIPSPQTDGVLGLLRRQGRCQRSIDKDQARVSFQFNLYYADCFLE